MKSSNDIQKIINRLNNLDTEGLSEKQVFQKLIAIVITMRDLNIDSISDEEIETISRILIKKGCVDYKTWKEIKYLEGKTIVSESLYKIIESGSVIAGASMVSTFIDNRFPGKKNGIKRLFQQEIGKDKPFLETWLENSYRYNEEEDLYLKTVSESDKTPERLKKEKEIKEKIEQKRKLINDIEATEELIKQLQEKLMSDKEKLSHFNDII